ETLFVLLKVRLDVGNAILAALEDDDVRRRCGRDDLQILRRRSYELTQRPIPVIAYEHGEPQDSVVYIRGGGRPRPCRKHGPLWIARLARAYDWHPSIDSVVHLAGVDRMNGSLARRGRCHGHGGLLAVWRLRKHRSQKRWHDPQQRGLEHEHTSPVSQSG